MAEKRHLITIGGRPGSGKSTVGHLLAEKLGYTFFSTGAYARSLAIERGMTLEAFNDIVAEDGSLDELIDREQKRIENEGERYIVDAHLGFHFVPSSFKVYLHISLEESARRILHDRNAELRQKSGDVMNSYDEALARVTKRIENHMLRYKEHYNIDPYDTAQYDLIVETDALTPETIVEVIATAYDDWLRKT